MFCSLSGEAATDPVITPSGNLYQRDLIEKYLLEFNKDPVTDAPLQKEDLIKVNLTSTPVKPKPPTATSIPSLLINFQQEWDALMLELFSVRKENLDLKRELSLSLYELDASKRVIARLLSEKSNEARVPEDTYQVNDQMDVDEENSNDKSSNTFENKLTSANKELAAARKKRKAPETLLKAPDVVALKKGKEISTTHNHGITTMDFLKIKSTTHNEEKASLFLTGSKDGKVTVRNALGEQLFTQKIHKKDVTKVLFNKFTQNSFFTAGKDGVVKQFEIHEDAKKGWNFTLKAEFGNLEENVGGVSSIALHPTGEYLGSSNFEGGWKLLELENFTVLHSEEGKGYLCLSFHPDALILGLGKSDGDIEIFDLIQKTVVQTFSQKNEAVKTLFFSENGYYLSSTGTKSLKFWDLRKLKLVKEIDAEEGEEFGEGKFDDFGSYFGIAVGNKIKVYLNKSFNELCAFDLEHHVSDFKFGEDCKYLFASSSDQGKILFIE